MQNMRSIHNQKNTAVLSTADLARIKRNAVAPEPDHSIEDEKTRSLSKHDVTMSVTETWGNSIVNQRRSRINRLQKEKEDHEEEMKQLDASEKQIQKSIRKDKLLNAAEIAFQEKPEIRAVNAQLLLHEVQKHRNRQILIKERQKELEFQREEKFHEEEVRKLREAEEREREIQRQRKEKARRVAEGFKQQKLEAEERKMEEKSQIYEEEELLQAEARRLLDAETIQTIKRKEIQRKQNEDNRLNNETLQSYKARQRELEELEEERIKQQRIKLDDDLDRRQAADRKRRQDRQGQVDRLIETQQRTLEDIKAKQSEFDDTQYRLQYDKDRKEIESIHEKQQRLLEERRADFLDTQAKLEAKRKLSKSRKEFPPDEETQRAEDRGWNLEVRKLDGLRDLADFQRQQANEKRERDAAERERQKLEYRRMLELEEQRTLEAQEYAREMLLQAKRK